MVAYAVDAIPYCLSMLGHGYVAGSCRCEVFCDTQDCSGYIVAGSRSAGLACPCISSAGFAVWGRQAGTLISEAEALHTPMAVAIKGPNGGEDGNGPLGHIVWMVGDGVHTYEAMGRRYGIVVGNAIGRNFVRWMKVPGLVYGPKPLPFRPEQTMLIQKNHFEPTRPTNPGVGKDSTISIADDGRSLECRNDASIVNDQPDGKPETGPGSLRRWTPAQAIPAGTRIKAIVSRPPDAEDSHHGGVALLTNGDQRRFHLS